MSGKSKAKSMYSPLSILSSRLLSTGLERPRGEALTGVKVLGVVAGGVRNEEKAECIDCVTTPSIA